MPLVTLKDVLQIAQQKCSAIPAFNIDSVEVSQAVVQAAQPFNCPIIMSIGQGAIMAGKLLFLADAIKRLAGETKLPLVLHLDHGASYEQTIQCLRAGFTSVMIDGSRLKLEDNIALTKEVAKSAHAVGVSVEAELGAISGVEDGMSHNNLNLVDVGDVTKFITEVHVEALAVGIGNAHGMYKGTPNLDFDLLKKCADLNPPPLVLHGGSGIPDDMIRRAIAIGVRKINVATEIRLAFIEGIENSIGKRDIYAMYESAMERVEKLATAKIRLFLSPGQDAESKTD